MNDKIAASSSARPIPKQGVYVDTRPFWDGIAQGKLVLQYCTVAGRFQHYPKPVSSYTGRRALEWREVSGKGVIYAATVVRIPGPGVEGRIPLCVATVELDEGVRIIANILNCEPAELAVGKRVRLAVDHLAPEHPYPAFELE
ncbi:Zn-ribbon domain-containing OB-fold protein [Bordetella flabilis]|uniref:Zn-ribbon domain-containing OB-fold protein n=1 Tax=Bordetella flabilis TaxID=463014 RepID=UPI000B324B0F|nr:OB-fold domain-containing protein [Bordetella flabilis]